MERSGVKAAPLDGKECKALVRQGYDLCATDYARARGPETKAIDTLVALTREGAAVLDIGCGPGVPITRALAKRFRVTGVDLSETMIELARASVPEADFVRADVMSLDFPDSTFDAVVALYSLFHLPRGEHRELFRRVHSWLKSDGYLLVTLTRNAEAPYLEDDFFGATMYWSNYGLADYETMLTEVGFDLLESGELGHGYQENFVTAEERHPILLVRKTQR
jgi:cyclopropane fatty-acyl-phospholipid synthase-like methyltransferase